MDAPAPETAAHQPQATKTNNGSNQHGQKQHARILPTSSKQEQASTQCGPNWEVPMDGALSPGTMDTKTGLTTAKGHQANERDVSKEAGAAVE